MSRFIANHFIWLFIIGQVGCFFFASLTNVEFALKYLAALCVLNIVSYLIARTTKAAREVVRNPVLLFLLLSPMFTFAIMAAMMSR